MRSYAKLHSLPLGSVEPQGFLREQMLRCKDGIGGHLDELEPEMIYYPFLRKPNVPAWKPEQIYGWGAEISGNYWTGLIGLAWSLKDPELMAKAEKWVNAFLSRQQPDGYLGTYCEPDADIYQDYNGWGTYCGMRALILYYEVTGREDVFEAINRCMLWFCDKWAGNKKTPYGGIRISEIMIWCYLKNGDERFPKFVREYFDFLEENDGYRRAISDLLSDDLYYLSDHSAGHAHSIGLPAFCYTALGEKKLLDAAENEFRKLTEKCVLHTGAVVCSTEYLAPVSSTENAEYCGFTFFQNSCLHLARATGRASYGDWMEKIFYNAAQGARTKDEKTIAYFSCANQLFASAWSEPWGMQAYYPCYTTSCCPVNAVVILPEFLRGMVLEDENGGLFMNAYGPCKVQTGDFVFEERTMYPFRNKVELVILSGGERTLWLKIPEWCEKWEIARNGTTLYARKNDNGYVGIPGKWVQGDILTLSMEMQPEIQTLMDGDAAGKYPRTVTMGPLVYALKVEPEFEAVENNQWNCAKPATPLPEGWHVWSLTPSKQYFAKLVKNAAKYQADAQREQITWNVAFDRKLKPDMLRVENTDTEGYVWEEPPTRIYAPAWKAPYAWAQYPIETFEPFGKVLHVTHPVEIELVPYGCTNLRMTYFHGADSEDIEKAE